jgi:hypothetical protein
VCPYIYIERAKYLNMYIRIKRERETHLDSRLYMYYTYTLHIHVHIYIYRERERERERESLVSDVDKRPRVGNRIGRVMPTQDSTSD